MIIPCDQIATFLQDHIKQKANTIAKKEVQPTLATILVGNSSEQLSFVSIKEKVAHKLGIQFDHVHLKRSPSFQDFIEMLKKKATDPAIHGMIVQQPLPSRLASDTLYNFIPVEKEIESHKPKSPFIPPIGLAVLTVLKHAVGNIPIGKDLLIDPEKDPEVFSKILKNKTIVLAGRGMTGGIPIGKTLQRMKIGFLNVSSQTGEPERFYKEADIIITAAGKKIIRAKDLKPGVTLLNVGLRREKGELKGDYTEDEIASIADSHTITPGGIGPIDVLYLYYNLLQAVEIQINKS